MPKYVLTYFGIAGRAEHIRYIFAYANQPYEDVRLKFEEWQKLKPTSPFGKLPMLEIDGKVVSQSDAIARYLAKQFGLAGKDDWEALQADIIVDTLSDMKQGMFRLHSEKDEAKKQEAEKDYWDNQLPFYLSKFEKIISGNPAGYLVGSQATWADLTFAVNLSELEQRKPGILKSYPAVSGLINKIHAVPGIKAWLEKRPADIRPPKRN